VSELGRIIDGRQFLSTVDSTAARALFPTIKAVVSIEVSLAAAAVPVQLEMEKAFPD
jgi:hypothetical protein